MKRAVAVVVVLVGLVLTGAATASAQTRVPPGRIEAGIGVQWLGATTLGSVDAVQTTSTGSTSRLFSTSSTLTSASGFDVHVGVRVWKELEAEAFLAYAKPTLSTNVSNDAENAAAVTATEPVRQYTIGGGGLWYLPYGTGARTQKLRLFASGRAAYLRQLHNMDVLAVTGRTYEFGGGVKYTLASRPKGVRTVGVRGDARIAASTKGVGFDDRTRYAPVVGASLFVRF